MKRNMEAPDGGWGYVIGGAMAVCLTLDRGLFHTYGMIFEELLLSVGGKATELIFIISAYVMCFSVTGLFVNSLLQRFSCRTVGLVGAFLFTAGGFLTSFATSFTFILVSFSVIQGIAEGLILSTIFTSFYQYFVKKRARMFFISKPFVALGAMGFPVLINYLLEQYGNRGMLLILSGVYAHLFVAMMLLQPVEWHMKKTTDGGIKLETINHRDAEETERSLMLLESVINENTEDAAQELSSTDLTVETKSLKKVGKINKILSTISYFLGLELLKDLSYVNLVVGICFVELSEITFVAVLPRYLISIGWTMKDVALCLSTSGVGDFASRISLVVLGFSFPLKGKHVFLWASSLCFIFRIAFLFVDGYIPVTIIVTVIVLGKTMSISSISLIFADHFPIDKFPAGFGLYLFFLGITNLTLGPLIGSIQDYTGSYDITLYILIFCYLICIIPWTVEILWKRKKNLRNCSIR